MQAIGYAEQALGLIKTSGQAALLNTQSELEQLIDILHKPEGTTWCLSVVYTYILVYVYWWSPNYIHQYY